MLFAAVLAWSSISGLARASQSIFPSPNAVGVRTWSDISLLNSEDRSLLKLHRGLIESESTSQGLEGNAADYLVEYFSSIGWGWQLFPTYGDAGRPNVLAWPGGTNRTRLLVSSHIDTVPPYIPYSLHDGAVWGRGSADAKASVATQIEAIRRLVRKEMISADDVAVLYVVGETFPLPPRHSLVSVPWFIFTDTK